ncbi:hypothetical protein [Clostridium estertheticum]|uniref:hypothetical protein n=1 Tax=Clostridium estertheticum TaxID=238834 RepID=UPI001C6DD981|nr:hypothetical protein [Clostridium estertheticum]MBW9153853.1 hypothetical protein [Clostridium estertheticum]
MSSCLKNESGISVSLSIDEYLKERQETLLDKLLYVSRNVKTPQNSNLNNAVFRNIICFFSSYVKKQYC